MRDSNAVTNNILFIELKREILFDEPIKKKFCHSALSNGSLSHAGQDNRKREKKGIVEFEGNHVF